MSYSTSFDIPISYIEKTSYLIQSNLQRFKRHYLDFKCMTLVLIILNTV